MNRAKLEQAVADFVKGLDNEPDTLEEMASVTKDRDPLLQEEVKSLTLSESQKDELYITEADKAQGKLGSSVIASVLSVHPDNYSDAQYYKVLQLELYDKSMEELYEAIREERAKHRIYYDDLK